MYFFPADHMGPRCKSRITACIALSKFIGPVEDGSAGEILREVPNARHRTAGRIRIYRQACVSEESEELREEMLTWLCRNIRPILRTSVHVVVIIHLVQLRLVRSGALDRSVDMAIPYQGLSDLSIRIRFGGAGHDARIFEEGVCIQDREELEGLFEIINHLLRWHIIGVAIGVEGADAGAVFAPLVFPEGLVLALIVFPVHLHVVQEIVAVEMFKDLGDVLVLAGFVAKLLVGAIAFIGPRRTHPLLAWTWKWMLGEDELPEAVDGPVIGWTGGGITVPELRLQ